MRKVFLMAFLGGTSLVFSQKVESVLSLEKSFSSVVSGGDSAAFSGMLSEKVRQRVYVSSTNHSGVSSYEIKRIVDETPVFGEIIKTDTDDKFSGGGNSKLMEIYEKSLNKKCELFNDNKNCEGFSRYSGYIPFMNDKSLYFVDKEDIEKGKYTLKRGGITYETEIISIDKTKPREWKVYFYVNKIIPEEKRTKVQKLPIPVKEIIKKEYIISQVFRGYYTLNPENSFISYMKYDYSVRNRVQTNDEPATESDSVSTIELKNKLK